MKRALPFAITLLALCACSDSRAPEAGSQTHFLIPCTDTCPDALTCVCGVCTSDCSAASECSALSQDAVCATPAGADCALQSMVCDVTCKRDGDCEDLGSTYTCSEGRCRGPDAQQSPGPEGDGDMQPGGDGDSERPVGDGDAKPEKDAGEPSAELDPACLVPSPGSGPCDPAWPRYYFDADTKTCKQDVVCDPETSRFLTELDCQNACLEDAPKGCSVAATSPDLPGLTVHVEADRCRIPVGEGETFRYLIEVQQGIAYTAVDSQGGCGRCGGYTSDPLSLTEATVGEGPVDYCECDVGCCPPTEATPQLLALGSYVDSLQWPGRQWQGPSDTDQPLGPAFPVGSYAAEVKVDVPGVGAVIARLPIEVFDPDSTSRQRACQVSQAVYASGDGPFQDPFSCNQCTCTDGELACDDADCPIACPSGTAPGRVCSQCAAPAGCEIFRHDCLLACNGPDTCPDGTSCENGVCISQCE